MRFPNFSKSWNKSELKTFANRINRRNSNNESSLPLTISAQLGLINQNDFFNKQIASRDLSNYILIKNGEFAYNKSYSADYPWGAIKRLDLYEKGALSSLYICFSLIDKVESDYFVHYFESNKWHKQISDIAGEGARNHGLLNMSVSDFFETVHKFPTQEEQVKISNFLNLINERILTQSKIIEDLESLKKSIINHYLYSNSSEKIMTLGEIINQVNNRNSKNNIQNVLSVNNKLGFIPQNEQFEDHEVASENKTNYKIVTQYDFAYNPARINVGSIAMLSENDTGIISPMYICFNVNKNIILPCYLDIFIHSSKFLTEVNKRLEGSVRLCLSFEGLSSIQIPVPTLQKQYKIINDVTSLIKKINIETKLLQKLKEQKKYLLSNMFI